MLLIEQRLALLVEHDKHYTPIRLICNNQPSRVKRLRMKRSTHNTHHEFPVNAGSVVQLESFREDRNIAATIKKYGVG
jgi:hypothetical protein